MPRAATALVVLVLAVGAGAALAGAGAGIRLHYWDVAAGMARAEPVRGEGAGTFALIWPRDRHERAAADDAHSLYVETLAELGLAGLVLLALALGAAGRELLRRPRAPGEARALHAVVLAVAVAWALHAGIDWIWEQPAIGVPVFAVAGGALGRPRRGVVQHDGAGLPATARRAAVIVGCCLVALLTGRLALASSDLEASLAAARRDDCPQSTRRAKASLRVRETSDARLVLARCALPVSPAAALAAVDRAVADDPLDWRPHYDRAVVLARLGRDPRPEIGAAHGLNLLEPSVQVALERLAGDDPAAWRSASAGTRFVLP
jgi:hypothetical protein